MVRDFILMKKTWDYNNTKHKINKQRWVKTRPNLPSTTATLSYLPNSRAARKVLCPRKLPEDLSAECDPRSGTKHWHQFLRKIKNKGDEKKKSDEFNYRILINHKHKVIEEWR